MSENQGSAHKNKAYAISDVEGTRKLYAEWAENYDKDTTQGMGYVAPVVVADLAAEFPDLSFGSYPFQKDGAYGANVVVRGQDGARVDAAMTRLAGIFPA